MRKTGLSLSRQVNCEAFHMTLLQEEQVADGDSTFSLAPGENQKPCPFLTDKNFEELANPSNSVSSSTD